VLFTAAQLVAAEGVILRHEKHVVRAQTVGSWCGRSDCGRAFHQRPVPRCRFCRHGASRTSTQGDGVRWPKFCPEGGSIWGAPSESAAMSCRPCLERLSITSTLTLLTRPSAIPTAVQHAAHGVVRRSGEGYRRSTSSTRPDARTSRTIAVLGPEEISAAAAAPTRVQLQTRLASAGRS